MAIVTYEREAPRDVDLGGYIERWTRVHGYVDGELMISLDWNEEVPDDHVACQLEVELKRRGLLAR